MEYPSIIQALIDNHLIICAKNQCQPDDYSQIDNLHMLISVATGVFCPQRQLYDVHNELKFNGETYN